VASQNQFINSPCLNLNPPVLFSGHPFSTTSATEEFRAMDNYWNSQASSAGTSLVSSPVVSSPPTTPGSGSENGEVSNTTVAQGSSQRSFILVIGGLGFIGSHTSLELLKAGYNVIIVDDLSNSYSSVFTRIQKLAARHYHSSNREMPVLHFHKLDYRSMSMSFLLESYSDMVSILSKDPDQPPSLRRQSRISGVIHFAAFKSVSDSISNPIPYYRNNVCGLVDLVELLGQHGIHNFVFSSSATVYGTKADAGRPLREEDLVHHPETYIDHENNQQTAEPVVSGLQSPYARSKYFCEAILADIAHSDPAWRIVALRYFNPIGCDPSGLLGEDPKGTPTNLFPVITQVLTGVRHELDVFGTDWSTRDGTAVRDFIHVSDVARGHVAAIKAQTTAPFRTFNLGSGTGTTVIEAVRSLEAASNKKIPVNWTGRRAGDVGFCVASNDRAAKELGWSTKESIPQCASDLWNYVSKAQVAPQ
jgi:UDP-glucose 4-epimerase